MADSYDLIVIGAGPGGYVAALRAAQLGMKVACVEKNAAFGGTCLNIGCIPSKALLDSSEHFAFAKKDLASHGVVVDAVSLDLTAMMKRKTRIVKTLTRGIASLFKKAGVTPIQGEATLLGEGRVSVSSGDEVRELLGSRILVASGSTAVELPHIPFDGERIISSTEALALEAIPDRMVVIGGGAIGLEMGSVWQRLGTKVTVLEFQKELVPGADSEMAKALAKTLGKQGLDIRLATSAKAARVTAKGVVVECEGGKAPDSIECDVLLIAVGRRAYSAELGLDDLGVVTDDRGRVCVDAHYATNIEGIYAIGDCIEGPMLAHKAEEEGVAVVELLAGKAGHVNYATIPNVVYTWPELASVGMSEESAEEAGHSVRCGRFPFMANGRARCLGESEGLVKIVADAANDEVLGVHILGPRASDLIAEAAVAMEFRATAEDIARSIHAHPTLAEAIKEAALDVDGRALHK